MITFNGGALIPAGYGRCPNCHGTGRAAPEPGYVKYKAQYSGYDAATDTLPCRNCGGQTMAQRALGYTKLRSPEADEGCLHEYEGKTIGNCLWRGTCIHCKDYYDIDSSD